MQELTIPFKCRGHSGKIDITVRPNQDHDHAWGLDIIFPSTPTSQISNLFNGFPVTKATIEYPPATGYGSLFGWIQVVKASKNGGEGNWEMDIYPYAKDLKSPFAYWGFAPTVFDAPAWDNKSEELVWRAQSFLCVLEDAGMSKSVKVIPGAGFGWGYDIHVDSAQKEGNSNQEGKIVIQYAEVLDVEKEWAGRLEMLRTLYNEWTFHEFSEV